MIYYIDSDLPTFKRLRFAPGLNVLLATKSDESTRHDTRNRAGKSSLVDLVRYLLGGERGDLLEREALRGYKFEASVDVGNTRLEVSRTTSARSKPVITYIGVPGTTAPPAGSLNITAWRACLGASVFGLASEAADRREQYSPSLRSLLAYFARKEASGGFHEPRTHTRQQLVWDWQVNLSYLLGLDWRLAQQRQLMRDRDETLRKRATDAAASSAEVQNEHARALTRATHLQEELDTFRVHPRYAELEREASGITSSLADLADQNTLDHVIVEQMESAIASEAPPQDDDCLSVFTELGVLMPTVVRARFDQVREFHMSVIRNRRLYLEGELLVARERIRQRDSMVESLDARRAEIMSILQSHGALEHFGHLQGELTREQVALERLGTQLEETRKVEEERTQLRVEVEQLHLRLQRDLSERTSVVDETIRTFQAITSRIYGDAGRGTLTIEAASNGVQITPQIHGDSSRGVKSMAIFCFDMTVATMAARQGLGPGFVIHDSHIFDAVDERQVAEALRYGVDFTADTGLQYIVTMNEDDFPASLLPSDFESTYVLPTRLTDKGADGGLFGFRFD
ncbi:DUF2326 domain-containing protein [bacterium]|nr:DUF2326 domain-containing protein [bacterium]